MSTERPDMSEPARRARAVHAVAGAARDADDLRDLLAMLGLDPAESVPAACPDPRVPTPRRRGMPMADLTAMLAAIDLRGA